VSSPAKDCDNADLSLDTKIKDNKKRKDRTTRNEMTDKISGKE
jgi:hypothetical protein